MSRSYFTPQAGREGKSGVKKEDVWGSTTSQAEFRGYEPAEMRNCRSGPVHTKLCHENSTRKGTQPRKAPPSYNWHRLQEAFPDHSAYTAVTASEQSMGKSKSGSRAEKPAWLSVADRPIPDRSFDANTTYNLHQDLAQQARQGHFPYRDEFAPRSKRLLYELAHQRISRDSVASGSTADTASAFTMSSKRSAAQSAARSAGRSQSEGSLVASSHHSASSSRVIGGIAKRRYEAQYRSPTLWPPDQVWLDDKLEKEGAAGLTFANFTPNYYKPTFRMQCEKNNAIRPLVDGEGTWYRNEADMRG